MPDYKEMYLTLFRATERAISTLIEAQRECEELYISELETGLRVIPLLNAIYVCYIRIFHHIGCGHFLYQDQGRRSDDLNRIFSGRTRPARCGDRRLSAADQPLRRAAGRHKRPNLGRRHESDGS